MESSQGSMPGFFRDLPTSLSPVCQCSSHLTSEVNIDGHILPPIFQIHATSSVKTLTLLPINPCWRHTLSPWSPQPGARVWKLLTAWVAPPPHPWSTLLVSKDNRASPARNCQPGMPTRTHPSYLLFK